MRRGGEIFDGTPAEGSNGINGIFLKAGRQGDFWDGMNKINGIGRLVFC